MLWGPALTGGPGLWPARGERPTGFWKTWQLQEESPPGTPEVCRAERDTCLWPGGAVCFLHRASRGRDRSGGASFNTSSRGGSIHHQVANSVRSKSTLPSAWEVGEAPGVFIREVTVPHHWLWAGGCVPGGDGGALGGAGHSVLDPCQLWGHLPDLPSASFCPGARVCTPGPRSRPGSVHAGSPSPEVWAASTGQWDQLAGNNGVLSVWRGPESANYRVGNSFTHSLNPPRGVVKRQHSLKKKKKERKKTAGVFVLVFFAPVLGVNRFP